ncbi:hypothetical protein [Actinomadura sp. DC4]|uniref:hypothetical protein n=1 Tax=Actinomadura sp. DC4 TaxID=3055069 RepID=UPI0025B16F7B|nr:hypothetical protein [Actinomadura sp. DC4]MDN3353854.1 hypothetical protein [Actinomadura sp. DC4]
MTGPRWWQRLLPRRTDESQDAGAPMRAEMPALGTPTEDYVEDTGRLPRTWTEPDPGLLRDAAVQAGLHDAGIGMYDDHSFETSAVPQYIRQLAARKDQTVSDNEIRRQAAAAVDGAARRRRIADLAANQVLIDRLDEEIAAAERHLEACGTQLDALQADHEHRRRRTPRATSARWAGAARDRKEHKAERNVFLTLGLVFLMLDLVLQYESFADLTSSALGRMMLAGAVSLTMIALPHLAGRLLRHRHDPAGDAFAPVGAVATLGVWAGAAFGLAWLRVGVLSRIGGTSPDGTALDPSVALPRALRYLHLSHWQAVLLFLTLILLTGLFALLYGLTDEHPALVAHRRARERLDELTMNRIDAVAQQAWLAAEMPEEADRRRDEAWDARREQIEALYIDAAHAYLHAAAQASARPLFSEAVGTWHAPLEPPGETS